MLSDDIGNQRVKIAADSILKLREVDVFRVLEWAEEHERRALAEWITAKRVDLRIKQW